MYLQIPKPTADAARQEQRKLGQIPPGTGVRTRTRARWPRLSGRKDREAQLVRQDCARWYGLTVMIDMSGHQRSALGRCITCTGAIQNPWRTLLNGEQRKLGQAIPGHGDSGRSDENDRRFTQRVNRLAIIKKIENTGRYPTPMRNERSDIVGGSA